MLPAAQQQDAQCCNLCSLSVTAAGMCAVARCQTCRSSDHRVPHPAQLSGANRQAAFHNVLHHSRNRLVITFLDIVDLLKPRWGAGMECWPASMATMCIVPCAHVHVAAELASASQAAHYWP